MTLKFRGTEEELKARVRFFQVRGTWRWLNDNMLLQFKGRGGEVLNWWPSKGTLSFQGGDPDAFRARWLASNPGLKFAGLYPGSDPGMTRVRAPRKITVVVEYGNDEPRRPGRKRSSCR